MSKVPLVNFSPFLEKHSENILKVIENVISSGQFILGKEVLTFEQNLANKVGSTGAVGVASGSDALLLALQALELPKGSKVITTPFTFFATASCIARLGYEIVFVDIDPTTYQLDINLAAEACTDPAVKAIIGVNMFGNVLDYITLKQKIRPDIYIIEDAAQSFGAKLNNNYAGTLGDIGIYSFFPAKNLGAFGDGGAVISNNETFLNKVKILRGHGAEKAYNHTYIGINSRLDAIQAAILNYKLQVIDEEINNRIAAYNIYKNNLNTEQCKLQSISDNVIHSHNYFVILSKIRDKLKQSLDSKGIANAIYYPVPLHLQPCFSYLNYTKGDLPVSETICNEILALPMCPYLQEQTIIRICNIINGELNDMENS